MSLREQIDQFLADNEPSAGLTDAIDNLLDAGGFDGFDPGSLTDALLHYADTSPLHIADALSSFLVEHSDIPLDDAPLGGDLIGEESYSNAHLDTAALGVVGLGSFGSADGPEDERDESTDVDDLDNADSDDDGDGDDEFDDDFDDGFDDDGFDADEFDAEDTGFSHDEDGEQPFEPEAAAAVDAIDFEEPIVDEVIDP